MVDKIFGTFEGRVFQQTIGFPLETTMPLFLSTYSSIYNRPTLYWIFLGGKQVKSQKLHNQKLIQIIGDFVECIFSSHFS